MRILSIQALILHFVLFLSISCHNLATWTAVRAARLHKENNVSLARLIQTRLRSRLSGERYVGRSGCPTVTRLTVEAQDRPETTVQAEMLLSTTQRILQQFAGDAGLLESSNRPILSPHVSCSARLHQPFRLQFVEDSDNHFFSDVDGRAKYKILGAPGADIGEFIAALIALDVDRPGYLTPEMVLHLFQERLSTFQRDKFHMQTDTNAILRWGEINQVENPLAPTQPEEISKLVSSSSDIENVGSAHLRALLAHPGHRELAASSIEAFFTVFFDASHPLRPLLMLSTLSGERKKDTGLVIISTDTKTSEAGLGLWCTKASPLVVPNDGSYRMMIYHRNAAQLRRKSLARFLAPKHPSGIQGESSLFNKIDSVAEKLFRKTMETDFPGSHVFLGTWHANID